MCKQLLNLITSCRSWKTSCNHSGCCSFYSKSHHLLCSWLDFILGHKRRGWLGISPEAFILSTRIRRGLRGSRLHKEAAGSLLMQFISALSETGSKLNHGPNPHTEQLHISSAESWEPKKSGALALRWRKSQAPSHVIFGVMFKTQF